MVVEGEPGPGGAWPGAPGPETRPARRGSLRRTTIDLPKAAA